MAVPRVRRRWWQVLVLGIVASLLGLLLLIWIAMIWARSHLWNEIAQIAADQGVRLEKPEIEIHWRGHWKFALRLQQLKGELQSPLPLTGSFSVEKIEARIELLKNFSRLEIEDLLIEALRFSVQMKAPPTEKPDPSSSDFRLPTFEVPRIKRPELPVELNLHALRLQTEKSRFQLTGEKNIDVEFGPLQIDGKAELSSHRSEIETHITLQPTALKWQTREQTAVLQDLALDFKARLLGAEISPLELQPDLKLHAQWTGLQFTREDKKKLRLSDQGGTLEAQASSEKISLNLQGHRFSSNLFQKQSDWRLRLTPLPSTGTQRKFDILFELPPLFLLDAQAGVPSVFDPRHPQGRLQGKVQLQSDLLLLVLHENPFPWRTRISGPFQVELAPVGDLNLQTQLAGQGFRFDIRTYLNTPRQEAEASGFFSVDFHGQKVSWKGFRPEGRFSAPYKLLVQAKKKFFIETQLQFHDFSLRGQDFAIRGLNGQLPFKQSWLFEKATWLLSPRRTPNAFARADFESFEPLESQNRQLQIQTLRWQDKKWGPLEMEVRFEQNLLRAGSWSVQVGSQGRLEGALQMDISIERPRLGLLVRAFDVRLQDLFPSRLLRTSQADSQGLSFRIGMDWDLANATALGRIDWTSIHSAQVLQILDLLDPQFENKTFNQARMVLANAYPTRLQVSLRGSVADLRLQTNVVALPDVRDMALTPYLVKVNEALYASPLYQELRGLNKTARQEDTQ